MTMNADSRHRLARFVANVALLRQAIKKDATREQVLARISLLEDELATLAEQLGTDDPALGEAISKAWQDPAKAGADNTGARS